MTNIVVVVIVASIIVSVVANPRFEWSVVGEYVFSPAILSGLVVTIEVTVISMAVGIIAGVIVGVLRLSSIPIVSSVTWFYVWLFRGVPVLVQLIFWYNISALYPVFHLGVPYVFTLASLNANAFITPFTAAILGLGLNEGAYMSEIVRAGFLSVEHGQSEAAYALGMSRTRTLFRVVLPQAMPSIIPPTGNQVISMLKVTALVSVLSLGDLLFAAQNIYTRTFQTIPLLIAASIWYIVGTSVLSAGQFYVERHFARGRPGEVRPSLLNHVARALTFGKRDASRLVGIGGGR